MTRQLAAALVKEPGVIEIEVGGALLRLRGQVDVEALARVLGVIEGPAMIPTPTRVFLCTEPQDMRPRRSRRRRRLRDRRGTRHLRAEAAAPWP